MNENEVLVKCEQREQLFFVHSCKLQSDDSGMQTTVSLIKLCKYFSELFVST